MRKNKLKISLYPKDVATEKVLFDDTGDGAPIFGDGELETGVPFTDTMDDGLEMVTVKLDLSSKTPFEPYDPVAIKLISGGSEKVKNYVMGYCEGELQEAPTGKYLKTALFVEPTKILDKIQIRNVNLTNSSDTLKKQVEKLLLNVSEMVVETGKAESVVLPFVLSESLAARLDEIPGEDFFFNDTNLRSALNEMLSVIDCRARVDKLTFNQTTKDFDPIVISATDMNAVVDYTLKAMDDPALGNGKIVSLSPQTDMTDYAGRVTARGYNSVSNNSVKIGPEYLRTDGQEALTTDNAFIDLHFPIERFNSVGFVVPLTVSGYRKFGISPGAGQSGTATGFTVDGQFVDITKQLVPSEVFNILSETERQNKLPYVLGSTTIGVSALHRGFLLSKYNIKNVIESAELPPATDFIQEYIKRYGGIYDSEKKAIIVQNQTNHNYNDEIFLLETKIVSTDIAEVLKYPVLAEFIPRVDTVVDIKKPGVYEKDRLLLAINDTQSANSLDVARHARYLGGMIRRTGNETRQLDMICENVSQLIPLLARITAQQSETAATNSPELKDYVVYQREYSVFDNYVKVRYSLSYDYNAVNEKLGINRERHIFQIPQESNDAPVVVKHFAVFSTPSGSAPAASDSWVNTETIVSFLKTITGESTTDDPIRNLLFKTKEATQNQGDEAATLSGAWNAFVLPLLGYGAGSLISFVAKPLDNFSVGYSRGGYRWSFWGGGGYKMLYSPYTDNAGEVNAKRNDDGTWGSLGFEDVRLGKKFLGADIDEAVAKLPVTCYSAGDDGVGTSYYEAATKGINVLFCKDRTQTPVFYISIESIPAKKDYGKIVIGSAFNENNNLVVGKDDFSDEMFLFVGGGKYRTGDERVKTAARKVGTAKSFISVEENGALKSKANSLTEVGSSWAVGDSKGNLFLAVNESFPNVATEIVICRMQWMRSLNFAS